jgi:glycosyltransferase involved in cell wall biosynthesis
MFGLERRIAYIPCGPSGIPEETGGAQIVKGHAPYIFSGGTSNRDYKTLISAFKENNEKLKILCNVKDVEGIEVPANVEILHDIHGEAFIDYMRNAYAVVIPIDNDMISSGQLVLLQAMSLKKPIIITRSAGVTDYADENCVLFVESHSVFGIRDAVSLLLNDRDVANQLAQNAHKRYKDNFTIEQFGERIADLLKGEFCL